MSVDVTVRPLQPSEWQVWKTLRLTPLADAPDAFGPALADALAQPEEAWQRGGARFTEPNRRLFIAVAGDVPSGLVSSVLDDDGTGHLGAM